MNTWLVLYNRDSKYGDIEGEKYVYPKAIANAKQLSEEDRLLFCLTKNNSKNNQRILGYGDIFLIEANTELTHDKRICNAAYLHNYVKFKTPLTFDEIGGDPRSNPINSINRISSDNYKIPENASIEVIDDNCFQKQLYARRIRRGQPKFRKSLLNHYSYKCSISGYAPENVLEACHIAPHSKTGINQIENGILLRADLHALFDDKLLKINPNNYLVEVDETLKHTPYNQFHGKKIRARIDGGYPTQEFLLYKYKAGKKS